MGCQKDIAEKIVGQGAEYVLSLKGNQSSLHEDDVRLYFEAAMKTPRFMKGYPVIQRLKKGMDGLKSNINSVGMVRSVDEKNGQVTDETRYFITSFTNVSAFAKAVRSHWGIENSLHWVLDVVFHEDDCPTRKDHSAENFSVIRHIVLNILKNFPAKMSLARKRRKCEYDADFMADVLLSAF